MAAANRASAVVDVEEAQAGFAHILSELELHPEVVFEDSRDDASAAIILHPATFDRLVEAAEAVQDLEEAESILAREPLESFADYHAQRMARRHQTGP